MKFIAILTPSTAGSYIYLKLKSRVKEMNIKKALLMIQLPIE